jgi:hypothetical protein
MHAGCYAKLMATVPDEIPPLRRVVADEPPPFLGTWARVYIAILCYLAVLIFVFYLFSRAFTG